MYNPLAKIWRLIDEMLAPKRYWCSSCQMECFDTKVARLPVKHRVGLCSRCNRWRPVHITV